MKKNKGLFILIAVLAVYFGLQSWNKSKEKEKEKQEEAAVVHVTDTAAEDIVSMKFDVGNGEMIFDKENGKWSYTPDPDFPLAQSYPEAMADAVSIWSPVIIMGRIPASTHTRTASLTSALGGSIIPTNPTKTRLLSR